MQSRWAIRPVCILLVLLVCGNVGSVLGQAVSGSLPGTITDASGAAVPNAQVTITEINTGIVRKAETNASGNYSFPTLETGVYRVSIEHSGFRTAVKEGVELLVNSSVRADPVLQPGQVNESVTITAEAPMLQTDRADTGRAIEAVQTGEHAAGLQPKLSIHAESGARYNPCIPAALGVL